MTTGPSVKDRRAQALAAVTAPGRPFELTEEEVRGHRMQVFRHRRRSLGQVLNDSADFGDREYLVSGDLRLTFSEHHTRVASVSRMLTEEYGVVKGDRIAIFAANSAEWVMTFWAATSIGAVVVGMNAMWSAREAAYALELCTPALIVADEKRRTLLDAPGVPVLSTETDIPRLSLAVADPETPDTEIDEDNPAVIIFTSGTTGRPKGATHSHRNVIAAADYFGVNDAASAEMGIPRPEQRRVLLIAPLFHMMSLHNLVVPRLVFGDAVIVYPGKFDIDRALRLIEAERVTQWGMVPTMATRLVGHGDLSSYDLSSLTAISLGTAPSSPGLKAALREMLPVAAASLGTTYGLTESSSAATIASAADLERYEDSVGTPVVTMQVEIRDRDGVPVPDGVEGEIHLRGPLVMLGYWNDPEATAKALDAEGWLRTGDIGVMIDGHLRIRSRRSDLIIRAGENVYPAEVEAVLLEHPDVRDCAVVGAPHEDLGQEVAAVVVTAGDISESDLDDFMRERIARYKVPSRWVLTQDDLPRNATGKVVRHRLGEFIEPGAKS
ncbi:class I adenylate-forming enzyme family protein [Dietzia sp. ANT_WB102]|uniref:class I adenylate-forming enzyme family protein n=1 Tax=Dietzia sp. ANT_WB102 TaxID=2597345 RepID=UPI0011EDF65B|nr:class I adenylate-forming enzyme family protein [Dietzia sp. ANT_WB102]KAA0918338.1 acyl--CoA ligase [Dietzia sp. ANT_WB102]